MAEDNSTLIIFSTISATNVDKGIPPIRFMDIHYFFSKLKDMRSRKNLTLIKHKQLIPTYHTEMPYYSFCQKYLVYYPHLEIYILLYTYCYAREREVAKLAKLPIVLGSLLWLLRLYDPVRGLNYYKIKKRPPYVVKIGRTAEIPVSVVTLITKILFLIKNFSIFSIFNFF